MIFLGLLAGYLLFPYYNISILPQSEVLLFFGEADYNKTKATKKYFRKGIMMGISSRRLIISNCKFNNFERGLYEKI
jgi:hypothetical protein